MFMTRAKLFYYVFDSPGIIYYKDIARLIPRSERGCALVSSRQDQFLTLKLPYRNVFAFIR